MTERGETAEDSCAVAECITLDSWEAFKDALNAIRQSPDSGDLRSPLLFRGQGNSCYRLTTTLERNNQKDMLVADYYRLISVIRPEIEAFTCTQWTIPTYPELEQSVQEYDSFSRALTFGQHPAYAYMAYLRHHGFPSPLLDWTRSPHVAAYFAFSDAADSERVAIYVLSDKKFHTGSNGVPEIHRLGPYVKTHQRHFLQQSDYTMCLVFGDDNKWRFAEHDDVLTPANSGPNVRQNFGLVKYVLPTAERTKALRELDNYNLNAFSLFGSTESLMKTIALRKLHLSEEF